MTQWGIFMFLVVLTIGIAALTLIVSFRILTLNYLRRPAAAPNQQPRPGEKPGTFVVSNDPATRSPSGSMAERRQIIKDMLHRKEGDRNNLKNHFNPVVISDTA